jgi:RHS repeat-associated protein
LVDVQGAGLSVQYAYDDDGNRVRTSTPAGVTRFLVDAANNTLIAQVLEERNGAGALDARYSYGTDLVGQSRGGAASGVLRDALGNVRGLTDPAGAVTDQYLFDGYGETIAASGVSANPYRYRGERQDADTGLYQLRARYYDSTAGRFLSRDPFAGRANEPLTLHRYLYAGSDPVNFIDPTGLDFQLPSLLTTLAIISISADVVSFGASIAGAQDIALYAGGIALLTGIFQIPARLGAKVVKESFEVWAKRYLTKGSAEIAEHQLEQHVKRQVVKQTARAAGDVLKDVVSNKVDDVLLQFGDETGEIIVLAGRRAARELVESLPGAAAKTAPQLKLALKLALKELPLTPKGRLVVQGMMQEIDNIVSYLRF